MEVRLPFLRSGVTYLIFFQKLQTNPHLQPIYHPFIISTMMKDQSQGWIEIGSPFFNLKSTIGQNTLIILLSEIFPMEAYEYSQPNPANQFANTGSSFHKDKLWNDSEATIKFVAPFLSFSREKRFKWSSIYWPENDGNNQFVVKKGKSEIHEAAKKISKMIDEEEKNQERMKQIKRTLSIGKSQIGNARKESHSALSTKKPFKLSKETEKIVLKLALAPPRKQSLLRDRHGNRCNMFQNPEVQNQTTFPRFFGDSTGFKTSRKMKLELPHNYYPGPGTYEIKRYLSQLDGKSNSLALNNAPSLEKSATK